MGTLGEIYKINDNITNAKIKPLKVLFSIINGDEDARLNRNKLKQFSGFKYNKEAEEFRTKLHDINQRSLADLISVCHILNISYDGANEDIAKRILSFLCNLEDEEDEEDDDEEKDDDDLEEEDDGRNKDANEDGRSTRISTNIQMRNDDNDWQSEAVTNTMKTMKLNNDAFSLSFRDVEDSIRRFDGKDGYPINKWINDFEEVSELMNWNKLQKLVFAKKSLDGLAKLLIQSERGVTTWEKLKALLKKEFEIKVSSSEIHKLMTNRQKKKEETVQEYVIIMREIGSRINMESEVVIQYIIDGIPDDQNNKTLLYGAATFEELKNKVKLYELMKSKMSTVERKEIQPKEKTKNYVAKPNNEQRDQRTDNRCFSCGEKGHRSNGCPNKSKGLKCFKCNNYGHKSPNCPTNKKGDSKEVAVNNIIANPLDKMNKKLVINQVSINALIDTGSQLNLIKESVYQKIGSPILQMSKIALIGFAKGNANVKGHFQSEVNIDDEVFPTRIYVVPNDSMNYDVIIGAELLSTTEVTINRDNIQIRKLKEDSNILNILVEDEEDDEPNIGSQVTKEVRENIKMMVAAYKPNQTKTTNVEMKIIVKTDEPISSTPRRLPFVERNIVDKQVNDWLEEGIVETSASEYASPVVLTRKKDGGHRLCIDYRKINEIIVKDRHPLPLIEDILDKLQEAKVFSSIDLKNGFFHVNVAPESRQYTAFITHQALLQFRKMPFGLCNSPAVFQKYIRAVFREVIEAGIALPYLDDLIILGKDEEEAMLRLKMVFEVARDYGLEINKKKCHFLKRKIEFLGHVIEDGKISPAEGKTKAVMNFPEPKNLKQVQSYLGLTGYFRKFIPMYSMVAKPLSDLMRKGETFRFDEPQKRSFNELKMILSQTPVLKIFHEEGDLELHTDASCHGYGAVLMQKANDNEFHPVHYYSKKTTPAEAKYISYELEILAVINALEKFRVYLLGRKFTIITDCSAFKQTMSKTKLSPRVARWALFLEQFDYTIEHRAGSKMRHVDSLSRYPVNMIQNSICLRQIKENQEQDPEIQTIKKLLEVKPYEDYFIRDEILYKREKEDLLVIPKKMQTQILDVVHGDSHLSKKKMEQVIRKDYYIPKLTQKIEKHVSNCISCILVNKKRGKQEGFLNPLQKEEVPLATYHVDHVGPLETTSKNYKHLLVLIDSFTKFVWLYPTKSTTSQEVINKLELQKQTFGNPAIIISDRGTAFTAKEFNDYCEQENIKHHCVTAGLPRANGQVERINSVIISVLSKLAIKDPTKWYKYIGRVQRILNSTYNRSIQRTPFELLIGTPMKNKEDLELKNLIEEEMVRSFDDNRDEMRKKAKEQIIKVQAENQTTYNKKRKPATKYKINDLVAIKKTQIGPGSKLKPKFLGPYRICKVKPNNTYDVEKKGYHEGPKKTTTCAEFLKAWSSVSLVPESESEDDFDTPETVEKQDGRDVGYEVSERTRRYEERETQRKKTQAISNK